MKHTKKRELILNLLTQSNKPMSAEEIYAILSQSIPVHLSTIYRALNALVENKMVTKHIMQDQKMYFSIKENEHKHQLICNICNTITNMESCPIEKLENDITVHTGFQVTEHDLEIRGICSNCLKKDHTH